MYTAVLPAVATVTLESDRTVIRLVIVRSLDLIRGIDLAPSPVTIELE